MGSLPLGFPRGKTGSDSKESACSMGDLVQSLGQEDTLEKGMAIHSSILARKIPWTEKPGGLQSKGRRESDTTEATEPTRIPMCKIDSKWEAAVSHWELSLVLCDDLQGWDGGWERGSRGREIYVYL